MSYGHTYRVSNNPKDKGAINDANNYYLTEEQQRELNNYGSCYVREDQHKNFKVDTFKLAYYNLPQASGIGFFPSECPFCGTDCTDVEVISSSEPMQKYTDIEHLVERLEVVRCPKCLKLLLLSNGN